MSSVVTLAPCPRCSYPHNQGQIKRDYWSQGFEPYVVSEVNCRNCGTFYDGRTNFINAAPVKSHLIGIVLYLSVMFVFFIFFLFALGIFYAITG